VSQESVNSPHVYPRRKAQIFWGYTPHTMCFTVVSHGDRSSLGSMLVASILTCVSRIIPRLLEWSSSVSDILSQVLFLPILDPPPVRCPPTGVRWLSCVPLIGVERAPPTRVTAEW